MGKLVAVTFQQGWQGYNGGEVAGFDADTATFLVKEGIAVKVVAEPNVDKMASPTKTKATKRRGRRGSKKKSTKRST